MKKLGVIGGMGPLATLDFLKKIIENTHASSDQEHLDVIVDNRSSLVDRSAFILGKSPDSPLPTLIDMAKSLERNGADFIAMPCNTAHYFYSDLCQAINIPFIHIAEATTQEIPDNKPSLLLGTTTTVQMGIYASCSKNHSLILPNPQEQDAITEAIFDLKANKKINANRLIEIFNNYSDATLILACTELPIIFDDYRIAERIHHQIIDPTEALARACVAFSGKKLRQSKASLQ